MRCTKTALGIVLLGALVLAGIVMAQDQESSVPASAVTSKKIKAIGYVVGGGGTKVVFTGTNLAGQASGEAKVEAKTGKTDIEVKVNSLPQPSTIGTEFLTYVLWAISPDGRTSNLGQIVTDKNGDGKLNVTTQLQTFAMIVTAEPYSAVRLPSEEVVLENDTKKNTKGKIYPDSDYKLMVRGQYKKMGNPLALTPDLKTTPLEVYEARNAVDIAKSQGAEQYAPDIFAKADSSLKMVENQLARKADKKTIVSTARQTVQFAEDSRALSVQKQETERIAKERQAAADAAAAKAKAEADAVAAAEASRQAELTAAKEARMKAEADAAAMRAKSAADAAAAEQAALRAKQEAAQADAERARQQAAALRASLLEQFNRVLETTDTPRGLVVNMADVLFDTGKYDLRQEAQIKLAKLSGIILAHPGLNLAVEGYTDSTGSDELNMKLSDQRANAVRDDLISQGLAADTVTAHGFGKTMPVADNSTAAGRQKNRRVEIIVSGEVIGQKIGK
jgi:outer membrane protein OmpA-like peptidoglycan-associated protein/Holliday junction resolvase